MPSLSTTRRWHAAFHEGVSQLPQRGSAGETRLLQVGQHNFPALACFMLLCITSTCGQHGATSQQVRVT